MQVEEYTVEGLGSDSELLEAMKEGEMLMLVEELGLEGQKELASPSGDINPYRMMGGEEKIVFSTIFPHHVEITQYKEGPIPLRVLQIYKHAKSLDREDMRVFEVWCPSPEKKDPILVAKANSYVSNGYILARWGEALEPFEKLREKAIEILVAKAKRKVEEVKARLSVVEKTLHEFVVDKMNRGEEPIISYWE